MRLSLSLLLALTIGCATGAVVRDFVVAPAHAVPPGVQKWAQFCSPYDKHGQYLEAPGVAEAINPDLKNRGLEGWELVSATPMASFGHTSSILYCFRQPMP